MFRKNLLYRKLLFSIKLIEKIEIIICLNKIFIFVIILTLLWKSSLDIGYPENYSYSGCRTSDIRYLENELPDGRP